MKFKSLLSVLISIALLFSGTLAHAKDVFFGDDSAPSGKIGLVWVEDQLRGNPVSYMSSGRELLCMDANDKSCLESGQTWQAYSILPPCSAERVENCVEGMSVGTSTSMSPGVFKRSIYGKTLKGSDSLGIPTSGTVSIWNVPNAKHTGGNSNYSVAVRILYVGKGSKITSTKIEAAIVPIVEKPGPYRNMDMAVVNTSWGRGLVHDWHVGDCVWQEAGNCAVAQFWQPDAYASLTVRVPQAISGWLHGRLTQPEISVASIASMKTANTIKTITVAGAPVMVQGSKPTVSCNDLSKSVIDLMGECQKRSGGAGGYVSQIPVDLGDYSDRWFNAFFPYTSDKADGLIDYWNFKSIADFNGLLAASNCLNSADNLVGVVSTNSLVYSGTPPGYADGTMNYNVRALHFLPDGKTLFQGTYDLIIRSTAARCLYGLENAPVQASISVTSANGESQVTTAFFNEKNGWMHFGAYGFTFSSPTVKVKLVKGSENSLSNSPVIVPKPKPSITTKPKPIIKITCVKGKLKKVVSGTAPKCPAGYKKK